MLHLAAEHRRGEHVPRRGVLPAGVIHRDSLLPRGQQPRICRRDLVVCLHLAAGEDVLQELRLELALTRVGRGLPAIDQLPLQVPHHRLRDRGVGDPVEARLVQLLLVLHRERAVVLDDLVVVVGEEVEEVLLEVGAGAADAVHHVRPDHPGQDLAELGRAHGARERHQHLPARRDVVLVGARRRHRLPGVEVQEVLVEKGANGAHRSISGRVSVAYSRRARASRTICTASFGSSVT